MTFWPDCPFFPSMSGIGHVCKYQGIKYCDKVVDEAIRGNPITGSILVTNNCLRKTSSPASDFSLWDTRYNIGWYKFEDNNTSMYYIESDIITGINNV